MNVESIASIFLYHQEYDCHLRQKSLLSVGIWYCNLTIEYVGDLYAHEEKGSQRQLSRKVQGQAKSSRPIRRHLGSPQWPLPQIRLPRLRGRHCQDIAKQNHRVPLQYSLESENHRKPPHRLWEYIYKGESSLQGTDFTALQASPVCIQQGERGLVQSNGVTNVSSPAQLKINCEF